MAGVNLHGKYTQGSRLEDRREKTSEFCVIGSEEKYGVSRLSTVPDQLQNTPGLRWPLCV